MALKTATMMATAAMVGATGPTLPCLQENCAAFMLTCKFVSGCNDVISCMKGCNDSNCENTCFDSATSAASTLAAADLGTLSLCGGAKGCFQYEAVANTQELSLESASKTMVTFDGKKKTTFAFTELNDPVMGGRSNGTWSLGKGYGIFDGEVNDVPSLKAPGFIKAAGSGSFVDISKFHKGNLVLSVRSTTPEYAGFRVTLASGATVPAYACASGGSTPLSRGCFKAKYSVPAGSNFTQVKIPFSMFSDKWSPTTGEQTTACADDSSVCLQSKAMKKIQRFEFWAEGANGKVHLEIESVSAEMASGESMHIVV